MLKFVVLYVLLWHEMCKFTSYAQHDWISTSSTTNISSSNLPAIVLSKINDTNMQKTVEPRVINNWYVGQQTIYINDPSSDRAGFRHDLNNTLHTPSRDNVETNGIGTHKVHPVKLKWDNARRKCIEEGGHLAVIRSEAEEKIVLQMMSNMSVDFAWVGYHRLFDGLDWISVFDEPVNEAGWRWSTKYARGGGTYHRCVRLVLNGGGLDDYDCNKEVEFVCKVSTV